MGGDITRSTFRADKHYTSVRMQQGRLQVDADWNEQADIQNHLRGAYVGAAIGAANGVPSYNPVTGESSPDSFEISVTPGGENDKNDLAIAPGHLYVNGTLCELEASLFEFRAVLPDSKQVTVSTLIVDGRKLEPDQWVEIYADDKGENLPNQDKRLLKIINVDFQKRQLTLSGTVSQESGKMRRRVTYRTQPDYPNPDNAESLASGWYLAYVDVWQRSITTVEDPSIREVALNILDTTTRSKTIRQLKLMRLGPNRPDGVSPESPPQQWEKFIEDRQARKAYLTAWAKLRPADESVTSASAGYSRQENQLYRVEIHRPPYTDSNDISASNQDPAKATFKWSRDNGSIISPIEKPLQGNIITIPKSSQDAWADSKPGQWIEITDEERELKGLPGALVRLRRTSDAKIEFDESGIDGVIPKTPTKVRRWDHTTSEAAIPVQSQGIPLEFGIKVKFNLDDPNAAFETGDYWLIPARAATKDIEWPNDQAELRLRQPLPQPPQGIRHDYCLLALVYVNQDGQFEAQELKQAPIDMRITFPSLMSALDKAGGTITGSLAIKSNLSVDDNVSIGSNLAVDGEVNVGLDLSVDAQVSVGSNLSVDGRVGVGSDLSIDGQVGVGTGQTSARLHAKASGFAPIALDERPQIIRVLPDPTQIEVSDATGLDQGVLLKVQKVQEVQEVQEDRIITQVLGTTVTVNQAFTESLENVPFQYQQPIARLDDSQDNPQFIVLANGNTGIGTAVPQNKLEVNGSFAAGTFRGEHFEIVQGLTSADPITYGLIQVSEAGEAKQVEFRAQQGANFTFTEGNVGVGDNSAEAKLGVTGDVQISETLDVAKGATLAAAEGNVGVGGSSAEAKLGVMGNVQISETLDVAKGATLAAAEGNVGVGGSSAEAKLGVMGNVQISETLDVAKGTTLAVAGNVGIGVQYASTNAKWHAKATGFAPTDLEDGPTITGFLNQARTQLEVSGATGLARGVLLKFKDVDQTSVITRISGSTVTLDPGLPEESDIGTPFQYQQPIARLDDSQGDPQFIVLANGDVMMGKNDDPAPEEDINLRVGGKVFARDITSQNIEQLSSTAFKEEITDLSSQEAAIILGSLNPVKFSYIHENKSNNLHAGFIAEDAPDLITSSDKQAIKILDVLAILTKVVKEHQATAAQLIETVKSQQSELSLLQEKLQAMAEQNAAINRGRSWFFMPSLGGSSRSKQRRSRARGWLYRKLKQLLRRLLNELQKPRHRTR